MSQELDHDERPDHYHLHGVEIRTTSRSHVCPKCGHKWWHKKCDVISCVEQHTCPACGEEEVTEIFSWKEKPGE